MCVRAQERERYLSTNLNLKLGKGHLEGEGKCPATMMGLYAVSKRNYVWASVPGKSLFFTLFWT